MIYLFQSFIFGALPMTTANTIDKQREHNLQLIASRKLKTVFKPDHPFQLSVPRKELTVEDATSGYQDIKIKKSKFSNSKSGRIPIPYSQVKSSTEKSCLLIIKGKEFWLPYSQISFKKMKKKKYVVMPRWLAIQHGLSI